jgi:DNA-directed RNA polymerase specialized sigma24 family protein
MSVFGLKSYGEKAEYWVSASKNRPEALNKGYACLPAVAAQVILLHHEEMKSFAEIATVMGKSISTVRHYYNRGIFLLHRQLERGRAEANT